MAIIEVNNLGKKYQLRHRQGGYLTLRDSLSQLFSNPKSVLKELIKAKEEFWALKDISFKVEPGEVIGIIGHNGAGKSTLLKILSQITPPTTGEIKVNGRVGSLLEVGTGFHPELSGRENIFLNGAILGMKRQEIAKKFDSIVEFSGIEKFLDTPVKHYSSGMYVRLAFAVAAHMEPDILIIDEVLAVGDADFQKKCLGKMDEITKKEGRTILFVSHNLGAVRQLCKKCILLEHGQIAAAGETQDILDKYLKNQEKNQSTFVFPVKLDKDAEITQIRLLNADEQPAVNFGVDEKITIEYQYTINNKLVGATCAIFIYPPDNDLLLFSCDSEAEGKLISYEPGKYRATVEIPAYLLNAGHYNFSLAIQRPFIENIDLKENIGLEITDSETNKSIILRGNLIGKLACQLKFSSKKI